MGDRGCVKVVDSIILSEDLRKFGDLIVTQVVVTLARIMCHLTKSQIIILLGQFTEGST